MARVTVEDCVEKVKNRFELVLMAARRAKDIERGATPSVSRDNDKPTIIALREIADETISISGLEELTKRGLIEDKNLFIEKLLDEFFKNCDNFLSNGFVSIKDEYIDRCNFLGKKIKVQLYSMTVEGEALHINDNGELILKDHDKEVALSAGDIL